MLSAEEARQIAARRAGSLDLSRLMEDIWDGVEMAASCGGMRTTLRYLDSKLFDRYGVPLQCRADAFDRAQDELRKAGYGVSWCVESIPGKAMQGVGVYAVPCTRLDITWDKDAAASNA